VKLRRETPEVAPRCGADPASRTREACRVSLRLTVQQQRGRPPTAPQTSAELRRTGCQTRRSPACHHQAHGERGAATEEGAGTRGGGAPPRRAAWRPRSPPPPLVAAQARRRQTAPRPGTTRSMAKDHGSRGEGLGSGRRHAGAPPDAGEWEGGEEWEGSGRGEEEAREGFTGSRLGPTSATGRGGDGRRGRCGRAGGGAVFVAPESPRTG